MQLGMRAPMEIFYDGLRLHLVSVSYMKIEKDFKENISLTLSIIHEEIVYEPAGRAPYIAITVQATHCGLGPVEHVVRRVDKV